MAQKKRRLPIKTETVELDGEYEGWNMVVRTNVGFGKFIDAITAIQEINIESPPKQHTSAMYDMLELVIVEWNFVDEAGNPIKPDREGFALLPIDLLALACSKAQGVIVQSPLATGNN